MSLTPAQYERLSPNAREVVDLDREHLPQLRAWRQGLAVGGNVLSYDFAKANPKPKPKARRAWLSRALAIACGNRLNVPGGDDGPGGPGGPTGGTPAASAAGAVLAA